MLVPRLLTQKRAEEEAILFAYLHLWLHTYKLSDGANALTARVSTFALTKIRAADAGRFGAPKGRRASW